MHDTAKLLDAFAQPGELFLADPIMLRIARLGISLLQLLEHCAFAMGGVWPYTIESAIQPLCQRTQESNVVVVGRVIGKC